MNRFSSLPRISQCFISAGTDIRSDQRVHRFSRNLSSSLPSTRQLRHLRVEYALLITIDLKRRQHVNLLNQQQRRVLLPHLLRDLCQ